MYRRLKTTAASESAAAFSAALFFPLLSFYLQAARKAIAIYARNPASIIQRERGSRARINNNGDKARIQLVSLLPPPVFLLFRLLFVFICPLNKNGFFERIALACRKAYVKTERKYVCTINRSRIYREKLRCRPHKWIVSLAALKSQRILIILLNLRWLLGISRMEYTFGVSSIIKFTSM